jgi:hypothetical protein
MAMQLHPSFSAIAVAMLKKIPFLNGTYVMGTPSSIPPVGTSKLRSVSADAPIVVKKGKSIS